MPQEIQDKEQYAERIKLLVPINELSPQLQKEIIQLAHIYLYKKKEFVFKQGDKDEFSFYNLEGDIELLADKEIKNTITGGESSACYAMARLQPRQFSARAKTESVVMRLDRAALDRLMVMDNEDKTDWSKTGDVHVSEIEEDEAGDWMTKMLQSELFCRLPTANIHQLFALLEPLELNAGDTVIKQGEIGDTYYIIQEGHCEVSRAPKEGAKPIKLAELRSGDTFGEEALLTEAKRNATITMLTDGVLMQLSKENFINIIKKSTLYSVDYEEGKKLVDEGAVWLDVRFHNEHEESRIKGSINIPLNVLRMQTDKLQKDKKYVIYCDSGGRSSAAAFLLTDRGFDVAYLADGISSVPSADMEENPEVAGKAEVEAPAKQKEVGGEDPPPSKEPPQEKPAAGKSEEVTAPADTADEDDGEMEPEIRAQVIEANLGKTNLELEKNRQKAEEEKEKVQEEVRAEQERLVAEKKRLEDEKKAVEAEARNMREQEELKVKKMKQEAEKRMAEEKKKLEQVYSRNTKEMEKLERLKKEAEEQIRKERERLEMETAEAQKKLQEADQMKKRVEEMRSSFEQESEKRKAEQEAMEKKIQAKARAKLEEERRKLAEEIARTNEEMASAQRERAAADAARKAAEEEAKKIIAEYKQQFEKEREAEQKRLDEERKKLKEESDKIRATLEDIQKTKQESEKARQFAESEAQKLREKQKEIESDKDKKAQEAVAEEIRRAEEKLEQATKNLENVQQAEESAEAAREVNEQELQRQKEDQERMKAQVEEDLAQFMEEQRHQTETTDKVVAHADHVKRIKERAEAAKKAAAKATDDLFADIASQLGEDK
ncbi:MAG TPA: cyclic nucleotide-binding domain-containing protein [Gammaproteobacteria bacterium]|nr:cyclic nucleotide-binding domain-containing protein [Gammaproteobacteria bacterium]